MQSVYSSRMNELGLLSRQLTFLESRMPTSSSHCRLETGDTVGNYNVGIPLGKGRFSTVWSAQRQTDNTVVAIKIYREGSDNEKYYANEVKILNRLFEFSLKTQTTPPNIIGYLGTFAHIALGCDKGPRIHPCVIFNVAGDSLSTLLKYCKRQYGNGIPIGVVKHIMREVLTGLAYLHHCNIIHTDIKPSNILLNRKVEELDETGLSISIADLGSSTFADNIFSDRVGTTQYIAPELIIDMPYGVPIDIWSAFTMCYELITGDLLFDVYGECDFTYGEDVDCEGLDGLGGDVNCCAETNVDNVETSQLYGTSYSSGSSGSEDEIDDEKINYRHLLLIAKVIGYPPHEFTRNARTYYNRRDRLKNNPDVSPMTIRELLFSNYEMCENVCGGIEEFLLCGLKYLPEDRITAEQALQHSWLCEQS